MPIDINDLWSDEEDFSYDIYNDAAYQVAKKDINDANANANLKENLQELGLFMPENEKDLSFAEEKAKRRAARFIPKDRP